MAESRFPESMSHLEAALIAALQARLGDAVSDIAVAASFDSPIPTLSVKFAVYDYLPIEYFYDRGLGGFAVDYGSRRVGMDVPRTGGVNSVEDVEAMVDAFAEEARLWIPDKFLEARGRL